MSQVLTGTPEELKQQFNSLSMPTDVASMLEIDYQDLIYYLYRMPEENRYTAFQIKKKNGLNRQITSPTKSIKILQRKLLQVLTAVYQPKKSVHGFVKSRGSKTISVRNVKTNANKHKKQRFVLNLDIKNFFPSINFGRVRGMFMATPYHCTPKVASVLAQICCFDNQLPQGAPTSPIVANMLCSGLDSRLQHLAFKTKCFYTRYADDITFSTSLAEFPNELAYFDEDGKLQLGNELSSIFLKHHFEINENKVRLQAYYHRQEVTGITVNQFPNVTRRFVQQIRAMLNHWDKNGYEAAQERHWSLRGNKHRNPELKQPSFSSVVRGKIAYLRMVRYKEEENDPLYSRLLGKYEELCQRDFLLPTLPNGTVPQGRIFISYSRKDEKFAQKLYQQLSAVKEPAWLDRIHITPGATWSDAVQTGLAECDIMYLIVSPESMNSKNVAHEWQYFLDKNKPIITILLRWAERPFQIARIQYIDFRDIKSFDRRFSELRKATYYRRNELNES